ncbi:LegC family aminotransferase [Lysobacter sp. 2RAF19]
MNGGSLQRLIDFVQDRFGTHEAIPLHGPTFGGREREYVVDCIDSTFVSSVGQYVGRFEREIGAYTGSPGAVATVNGTAALHIALLLAGVQRGDRVITQPLTFIGTVNAIAYCGAQPVFVDVDRRTLGMSPQALSEWLEANAFVDDAGVCRMRDGQDAIRACLPMHTFGHPCDVDALIEVCECWKITLVEDAAESMGSFYKQRHTGTFGRIGTLSFNGNKVLTTGGGGMILCRDPDLAAHAKHLTTTAKRPHAFEFVHDELGYNYRMPNINAALGCAQLEQLEGFIAAKRALAAGYADLLAGSEWQFFVEAEQRRSNYWLNAVICEDRNARDALLKQTNDRGVGTRPVWTLMHHMPMYANCVRGDVSNAEFLEARIVNLPSSVTVAAEVA